MTKEKILKMAKQAGFERLGHDDCDYVCYPDEIEAFATLIAEKERERMTVVAMDAAEKAVDVAMKLEREACAKVVDHILKKGGGTYGDAIRARGLT